ncbi:MAG: 5-amino-6-(D-ribitylamino)uracil--L-tyrosine 4-hydroxyphenyl transferase CofH, partial [Candidatus Thorarchaeota archaeon]
NTILLICYKAFLMSSVQILEKPFNDDLITKKEALKLLKISKNELPKLIESADNLRKDLKGEEVTYVVNRNINFTNFCIKGCRFCYFSQTLKAPELGYFRSEEELRSKVREASNLGVTEFCIQGGIHPESTLEMYQNILHIVHDEYESNTGKKVHIHAFSPEEIKRAVQVSKIPVDIVLAELKNDGLGSLPGTAAEILNDDLRKKISPGRIKVAEWKDIISKAHQLGIPTTSTMMYGHVETPEHIIEHMNLLREIQISNRDKGLVGFTEFVPLRFINEWFELPVSLKNTNPLLPPDKNDYRSQEEWDIRIHAIARLFFGNLIPNIQASYTKMGVNLTQKVLNAGGNDLGGTLMEENITNAARKDKHSVLNVERLTRIAKDIERPVKQRTTLYADITN